MPKFSNIHNYYERLASEFINEELIKKYPDMDDEFFLDVACYALTRLPSRYIRHEIDMAFFLSAKERNDILDEVKNVILEAAEFIYGNQESAETG